MQLKINKPLLKQKLKCYEKEINKYLVLYKTFISPTEAIYILNILEKKYKIISIPSFNFKSKWYGAWAHTDGRLKFRKKKLNILLVCHEYCHLICYKKGIKGHNRKFYKELEKVINYIQKTLKYKITVK